MLRWLTRCTACAEMRGTVILLVAALVAVQIPELSLGCLVAAVVIDRKALGSKR